MMQERNITFLQIDFCDYMTCPVVTASASTANNFREGYLQKYWEEAFYSFTIAALEKVKTQHGFKINEQKCTDS